MKKIVLTGGGTAGHVTPNIALTEKLKEENFKIDYIGSHNGIEKELLKNEDFDYHSISSGKLRRYLSKENFTDIFKIVKGVGDARKILKKIKPDIIFSKGGFVTVPVVLAGKSLKIPVVIHESDITCGLANKISMPFSSAICYTFPETELPKEKSFMTGTPIRKELFAGIREKGLKIAGFKNDNPVILVMGGSLGSVTINNFLRESLDILLKKYNVIHLCGKNNLDENIKKDGYVQFEYIGEELPHLLKCADIIISRAGANSISEFLALKKPNLLIPLTLKASRGDQILNAKSFQKQNFSMVLNEEDLDKESLIKNINELYDKRDFYIENMSKTNANNGVAEVYKVIESVMNKNKK